MPDDIEAEARAAIEAYGKDTLGYRYIVGLIAALDRLRAPPGADVIERLERALWEAREDVEVAETTAPHRCPFEAGDPEITAMARAAATIVFQQYGDERAQEARAAAIEWVAVVMDNYHGPKTAEFVRSLA